MSDQLFEDKSTTGVEYGLVEDPLSPGDLMLEAQAGSAVIRLRFNEDKATRLAAALNQHYFMKWMEDNHTAMVYDESWEATPDTVTEYRHGRDGVEYSIHPFTD